MDPEDVGSVTRFNKHNLILMTVVQWFNAVLLYREMENGNACLQKGIQIVMIPIDGGD